VLARGKQTLSKDVPSEPNSAPVLEEDPNFWRILKRSSSTMFGT